jgi:hypothetical protein
VEHPSTSRNRASRPVFNDLRERLGLGQVAQAKRDRELLQTVDILHRQLLTQIKWLKTRLKEASPQILTGR